MGSTLASNIHCNINPLSDVEANPNSMAIPYLTVGEIINVKSSLNNSSAGYDERPASILKKCIDEYITPITYLVNLSMRQGIFPNEFICKKNRNLHKFATTNNFSDMHHQHSKQILKLLLSPF